MKSKIIQFIFNRGRMHVGDKVYRHSKSARRPFVNWHMEPLPTVGTSTYELVKQPPSKAWRTFMNVWSRYSGNNTWEDPMQMTSNVCLKCMSEDSIFLACWVALIVCIGNGEIVLLLGRANSLEATMGSQQLCLKRSHLQTYGYGTLFSGLQDHVMI